MLLPAIPVWKQAPFLRVLLPLSGGILLQWYYPFSLSLIYNAIFATAVFIAVSYLLKGYLLFRYKWIWGVWLTLASIILGAWITQGKNIQHRKEWFGHYYNHKTSVIAVLEEPLIEKNRSYKALAKVYALSAEDSFVKTAGHIIIYFQKDSILPNRLNLGSVIIFNKPLQPITNTGNPGAFDYKRYCLFQSVTHQVFLITKDFAIAPGHYGSSFSQWLHHSRAAFLHILGKYLHGREETAIAEALLMGYREHLDRDLVQAYSNTGVVHIIAISGMHLAMIYGLLLVLLKPLQKRQKANLLRGCIILIILWTFAFISGGGASVLRSTVMFSFIIVGQYVNRQVSVYHTLSASAFFLLCYNPFYLWDVGFQLSYAAVLSIVIFLRPITNLFYLKNKIAHYIWKLIAVTLAAQVLTIPLSIYHFHQLPNLFLLSNLLIVPLSGLILYSELLLCATAFIEPLAIAIGYVISIMLKAMNTIILWINALPFAVSNNILLSVVQTLLLYVVIIFIAVWLLQKKKQYFKYALLVMLLIITVRSIRIFTTRSNRIIVYNVPGHSAIDFASSGNFTFIGDDSCRRDAFISNFYINPSRLIYRINPSDSLPALKKISPFIYFSGKKFLLLNDTATIPDFDNAPKPDIIILSKNAPFSIAGLHAQFNCSQYVFDASNNRWKTREWKNDCDSLHLRRHFVAEDGAFVFEF
ncbi:MAG: ComEC/Rec2 family competence protein [Bacteroidetes bacterium]|nr:ComEC/Rec2 family competence protein [Bacteroidota bacterium]